MILLPTHDPCGNQAYGHMHADGSIACEETRIFERCACKPHKNNPNRGQPKCGSCEGRGWIQSSSAPGCGSVYSMCPCGNRCYRDGTKIETECSYVRVEPVPRIAVIPPAQEAAQVKPAPKEANAKPGGKKKSSPSSGGKNLDLWGTK